MRVRSPYSLFSRGGSQLSVFLIISEMEVESKCEEQCVALIETGLYLITCNPVSTVSVGMQLAGKSWRCCLEGGTS